MWPFRRKHKDDPSSDDAELVAQLRHYIDLALVGGFRPLAEISEIAIEIVADEFDERKVRALARKVLSDQLSKYRESQSTWPQVTDCDRLDAAFAELEESGIVARQNATCCQTCAGAEVWDEVESKLKAGEVIRGMTFYHEQDTESAVEGGGLYLAYGSVEGADGAAVAIGEEVRKLLQSHGLQVSWNGQLNQRIHVTLDWKRRRSDVAA
ncbi:MAG: hypothetical protein AAF184_18385 [Pseudomonadota bacterium]